MPGLCVTDPNGQTASWGVIVDPQVKRCPARHFDLQLLIRDTTASYKGNSVKLIPEEWTPRILFIKGQWLPLTVLQRPSREMGNKRALGTPCLSIWSALILCPLWPTPFQVDSLPLETANCPPGFSFRGCRQPFASHPASASFGSSWPWTVFLNSFV